MNAIGYLIGAGSMSLGIEQAGFTLSSIWETPEYGVNARTWDLNRPELRHTILPIDCRSDHFTGLQGADLIYGNPPCGGVSSMGVSTINNPTNAFMRHWLRMVVKGRPRHIVMESGWQLAAPKFARLLKDLTNVLEEQGYRHWPWQFFSWQLGTPQTRRRMFLCATLDPIARPELLSLDDLPKEDKKCPNPYERFPGWAAHCGHHLEPLLTAEPTPEPFDLVTGWGTTTVCQHYYDTTGLKWNAEVPEHYDRFKGSYLTPKQIAGFERLVEKHPGDVKRERALANARRILWEDCPTSLNISQFFKRLTILKAWHPAPTMIGVFRFIHPVLNRLLTMREMALLMGYPLGWPFHKLDPHYAIQGVPVNNAFWVADRLLKVVGLR